MSDQPPFEPAPPPPTSPPRAPGIPWEEPEAGFGALLPTIAGFIARPIESFSRMSLSVDLVRPLAYYVVLVLVGTVLNLLWGLVFFRSMFELVRQFAPTEEARRQIDLLMTAPTALGMVLQLVVTPFLALIVLFIWSGIAHVVLLLLGGARNGFAASLRAMCYSRTSALAQMIPLVGGLISVLWDLVLQIVGLTEAHKTDGWKAALAVILPIVVCCLCGVVGAVVFGAAIAQAFHNLR